MSHLVVQIAVLLCCFSLNSSSQEMSYCQKTATAEQLKKVGEGAFACQLEACLL